MPLISSICFLFFFFCLFFFHVFFVFLFFFFLSFVTFSYLSLLYYFIILFHSPALYVSRISYYTTSFGYLLKSDLLYCVDSVREPIHIQAMLFIYARHILYIFCFYTLPVLSIYTSFP